MLDEKPLSTLSPESLFNTTADIESSLNGMYRGLGENTTSPNGNWKVLYPVFGWGIMGTDELSIRPNNTSQQSRFSRYTLTAGDDQLINNWYCLYNVINRANTIIAYAEQADVSPDYLQQAIGEALFMRAFCYMDLVQFYGGVPLRLVPTENIKTALGLPRASEQEVWARIIEDLTNAEQVLPSTAAPGRATKWAAKGLLAKAYLIRGGYPVGKYAEREWFEKAAAKAYEVIEGSGISLNPTTPGSPGAFVEYGKQFMVSGKNSPESIFEIQFLEGDFGSGWGYRTISGDLSQYSGEYGSYFAANGGTAISMDFALSFDDNDIRFQWSIGPFTVSNGLRSSVALTQWMPHKHRWESRPPNSWESSMNAIVLRMADIYLIFAEAYNEANDGPSGWGAYPIDAFDAINVVRNRAQVTPLTADYLLKDSPYATEDLLYGISLASFDKSNANYDGRHVYYKGSLKERFRDAVLMERAWELCFERHRWFDLKRTNRLLEFASQAKMGMRGRLASVADPIDKSNFDGRNQTPAISGTAYPPSDIRDHHVYLPIPNIEIQLNPEISQADQNPGY